MNISRHGGKCCGIKHIFGFNIEPSMKLPASAAASDPNFYSDHAYPGKVVSGIGPCPSETAEVRFVRNICWLEGRRSNGIIEVVLASGNGRQVQRWGPKLKKYGFVKVTPKNGVKNSNSGNRLHVYHRYSGMLPQLTLPRSPEVPEKAPTRTAITADPCGDPRCSFCYGDA